MQRLQRAKETGKPGDSLQVSWVTAEVAFDKHGEPFDAEATLRQGIVVIRFNDPAPPIADACVCAKQ